MKIKGLKKAIIESKKTNLKFAKRYYYDLKTMKVWLDVYESYSSYSDYHTKYIIEVARGDQTQKTLKENIEEAIFFKNEKEKNYNY